MSLQQVKEIDERSKNLVCGYVRISNPIAIIPMDICYICLLFYYLIPEKFIKASDNLNIKSSDKDNNQEDDVAELQSIPASELQGVSWLRVHGNMIIDPTLNPKAIISWTIKSKVEFCQIGIHSNYTDAAQKDCDYEWYGANNEDDYFWKGDEIKLELNIPKEQITYYRNGKLSKVTFENIDLNKKYHLVLKLHQYNNNDFQTSGPSGQVQLIDYHVQGHQYLSFYSNELS